MAREKPIGVTVCKSLRMVLCAALFCGVVQAQQSGSASELPDVPSATVPAQSESKPDVIGAVPVVNLLAGRSRVFPNLAVNTTPLSKREKFELFANNSVSGYAVIGSGISAGISQARDTYAGFGQGADGYFKRFGASLAFGASNNLFGTFVIASALHEDPRYFVENSGKIGESIQYATSRVFICRMDDGSRGVNWAGILGPLAASALANVYVPPGSQGVGPTFSRWGTSLAIAAGSNLLREYWPHINKKLRLPDFGLESSQGAVKSDSQPAPPQQH
ncbi:MAG: hypothetical protein WBS19_10880 [Candidatus Korobacteraceae bacterium]